MPQIECCKIGFALIWPHQTPQARLALDLFEVLVFNDPFEMMVDESFVEWPTLVVPSHHAVICLDNVRKQLPVDPLAGPRATSNWFIQKPVGQTIIGRGKAFTQIIYAH